MKCRYCDYVPATHYKDGREKAEGMRIFWLADHMQSKHREQAKEHERRRKLGRLDANDQEHALRSWGENTPAMCECGLTVKDCVHQAFTLGLPRHEKTVDE